MIEQILNGAGAIAFAFISLWLLFRLIEITSRKR